MKTFCIFLITVFFSMAAYSQDKDINTIFQTFKDKPGVTSLNIPFNLISLFIKNDSNVKADITQKIKDIRLLNFEQASRDTKDLFLSMTEKLSFPDYKVIMTIKNEGEKVKILALEKNGLVKEFILLVMNTENPLLLSMTGNINLRDLNNLSEGQIDNLKSISNFSN